MRAPASMTNSCDSSSRTTAAVRPAALLALPLVYTALGAKSSTCLRENTQIHPNPAIRHFIHLSVNVFLTHFIYLRNWLFDVLGSPTMHTLISPRKDVPSMVVLATPPNNISRIPRLISSLPEKQSQNHEASSCQFNIEDITVRIQWNVQVISNFGCDKENLLYLILNVPQTLNRFSIYLIFNASTFAVICHLNVWDIRYHWLPAVQIQCYAARLTELLAINALVCKPFHCLCTWYFLLVIYL